MLSKDKKRIKYALNGREKIIPSEISEKKLLMLKYFENCVHKLFDVPKKKENKEKKVLKSSVDKRSRQLR